MPLDLQGIVEIRGPNFFVHDGSERIRAGWVGAMQLDDLAYPASDIDTEIEEGLFGCSKRAVSEPRSVEVAFRNRGVPQPHSAALLGRLLRIRQHEQRYGFGEFGGFTFATLREIQGELASRGISLQGKTSAWRALLEFMSDLEMRRNGHFGVGDDDYITRVVCWWAW